MAASTSAPTSLPITLAHAISYLTRPLILSYPATTIIKLQLLLEANLTALYAPTWSPNDPTRGSGRRCLALSASALPPRPIYTACVSAQVVWADWIALLSKGRDMELWVDPAKVSVRIGQGNPIVTIWSEDSAAIRPTPPAHRGHRPSLSLTITTPNTHSCRKSLAQQIEDDMANDENELFAMLADEISVPTWRTPTHDQFPLSSLLQPSYRDHIPSCDSPLSDISSSTYSRSSSRSDYYLSSSPSSCASTSPSSPNSNPLRRGIPPPAGQQLNVSAALSTRPGHSPKPSLSRRERAIEAREAREASIVVDLSKTEVTPYDNGKVGVLTGGVMLGGCATSTAMPIGKSGKSRPVSMIAISASRRA